MLQKISRVINQPTDVEEQIFSSRIISLDIDTFFSLFQAMGSLKSEIKIDSSILKKRVWHNKW